MRRFKIHKSKESRPRGSSFGYPKKVFALLKFQITNPKKQTNNNDQNSKPQTKKHSLRTGLEFVICDLSFDFAQDGEPVEPFVIWCLEFVILDTKRQGRGIYL